MSYNSLFIDANPFALRITTAWADTSDVDVSHNMRIDLSSTNEVVTRLWRRYGTTDSERQFCLLCSKVTVCAKYSR